MCLDKLRFRFRTFQHQIQVRFVLQVVGFVCHCFACKVIEFIVVAILAALGVSTESDAIYGNITSVHTYVRALKGHKVLLSVQRDQINDCGFRY